jgi:nucleoside-diphosphate-sugar epimerase
MREVVVTGGSGKAGRAVVRDLLEAGYDVLNADTVEPGESLCQYIKTDLTDLGETFEVLRGVEGVVHLAAIPAPGRYPEGETFRNNTISTYNVFSAATSLGAGRIVWASSETTLGLPFDREKPAYAPIDEDHPLYPESSYALSKTISEEMARQFSRTRGTTFAGLRISNIMVAPGDYERFLTFQNDPRLRKWNLWGYVDARDVAQACRLALEADLEGAEVFIVAAADTVMERESRDLMAEVYPEVPLRDVRGRRTLLSIEKARRKLGYSPKYSWRENF